MSAEEKKNVKKKGGIIAFVACGVVIVALVTVVVVLLVKKNPQQQDEPKRNVVVTPDNVEEIIDQMEQEEYVAPGSYEVTMNTTWNFADGASASSNAYVENAVSNTNDVYFDITLADTEENIYSSPVLPIGSHIENITLDKVLDNGTYDCVITYTLIDEEQHPLSSVRVSLTIIIGE